jgi:uncharacterized membrane protein YphA (DoxX/SURF4 family)
MQPLEAVAPIRLPEIPPAARWSPALRIAFRFLFSYFVLCFLIARILGFNETLLGKYAGLWHVIVVWVGKQVLHTRYDIDAVEPGISNTAHGTILFLCYVALAAVATAVWSALDRKRENYARLHQWFRLLLRLSLALAMISYGTLKVIPTQMTAPPPPFVLLQRFGELPPMRLLWLFIGSSPAYESFTGCAELLGGILLLLPRTTLLGALICCADMTMVVMLNFCYDVHVKLYSLHLLCMAVLLVAPDLRRLAGLFLFNRTVEPAQAPRLFARKGLDPSLQALFLLLGLTAIGVDFHNSHEQYKQFHPPRPPLYGAWSVDEFAVDGKEVPLYTDPQRWRWAVFQNPGRLTVELMIGARQGYNLDLDMKSRIMMLAKRRVDPRGNLLLGADGKPQVAADGRARFSFDASRPDALILDGTLNGHPTHAKLSRMALTASSFRWIIVFPKEEE